MRSLNVNPRRDFVSSRYGKFASSANKSFGAGIRSSKTSGFRGSNPGHETSKDFMSKLKNSTPGNVYIPSNGVESVDINNYIENLLM
jgi:hypothetical protein